MAENKKILIEVKVSDKASKPLKDVEVKSKDLNKSNELLKKGYDNLNSSEKQYLITKQKEKIAITQSKAAVEAETSAILNQNKAKSENRAQSGLSNAILIESGRVASDAAYGIQGVANNLGRLIELGQEFARTNKGGGMAGALKQLRGSFLGLGGVIIGVQLLLSFLPKITKAFQNWLAEITAVTKALRDATDVYGSQIGALETYISFVNDSNVSDDQRRIAISKINDEFSDLNIVVDENTGLTNEQKIAVDEYINTLKRQAESQALVSAIQEKYKESFLNSSESIAERLITWDGFVGALKGIGVAGSIATSAINNAAQAISDDGRKIQKDIDLLLEKLKQVGLFDNDPESENGLKASGIRRIKVFKEVFNELEKLEEKYRERAIDRSLMTEREKIAVDEENNLRDLNRRTKQFEERERLRLKNYVKQINEDRQKELDKVKGKDKDGEKSLAIDKKYNDAIKDANATFNKEIIDSKRKAADVEVQIKEETNTKILKLERKERERARKELERQIVIDRGIAKSRSLNDIRELTLVEDQKSKTVLEGLLGLKRSELMLQRDLVDEKKNISDREVGRLQGLLDNDELVGLERSKLERQLVREQQNNTSIKITLAEAEANAKAEALNVTSSAMNSFAKLVGENSKEGKALSVAATLISTYSSAQKAYESQFTPIPTPDSPIRGTIAAAAAVASGLANVKAIMKVDSKGETSAGAKPSVQAPSFNVVGTSSTDQLAQAVSGKVNEPLKAYVVGKDITNQQELDRTIINTAGL